MRSWTPPSLNSAISAFVSCMSALQEWSSSLQDLSEDTSQHSRALGVYLASRRSVFGSASVLHDFLLPTCHGVSPDDIDRRSHMAMPLFMNQMLWETRDDYEAATRWLVGLKGFVDSAASPSRFQSGQLRRELCQLKSMAIVGMLAQLSKDYVPGRTITRSN
jgi:hypothetical protein